MKEKNLTVIEHIDEIRKRLMVIVVFFVIAVIGSFFIAKPIIEFLLEEGGYDEFHAFNVVDPIVIYLKGHYLSCGRHYFTDHHVPVLVVHITRTS